MSGSLLPGADHVTNARGFTFGGWVTQSNSGGGLTKITTMPGVANMILQAWWLEDNPSSSSSSSSQTSSEESSALQPITVNFKRTDTGWSGQVPKIYVYVEGGNAINGAWPGGSMTASDNGWYTYSVSGYESLRVIFYVSTTYRDPADMQPGFQALPGTNTYIEGVWTSAI